jgi:hypothetical protein
LIPEGLCPGVKTDESSMLMLSFPLSKGALLIGLASRERMVELAAAMRLSGNGPSHEANAASLRNFDKSGPTSPALGSSRSEAECVRFHDVHEDVIEPGRP